MFVMYILRAGIEICNQTIYQHVKIKSLEVFSFCAILHRSEGNLKIDNLITEKNGLITIIPMTFHPPWGCQETLMKFDEEVV